MFDSDIKKRIHHREDMFLRRLFGILAKMAKADGKVDAWETHAAEAAFAHYPRAAARRQFCVRIFNEAKDGRIPLYRLAWEFSNKWAAQEDCLFVYGLLWDVACATGVLKPVHKANLEGICRYLNLPANYFGIYYRKLQGTFREWTQEDERCARDEARHEYAKRQAEARRRERERQERAQFESHYQERMREWYRRREERAEPRTVCKTPLQRACELLGCGEADSNDVLRRAYRLAAKRNHPDSLRARGCTEAQIAEATDKMVRINAAWEIVKRERGM